MVFNKVVHQMGSSFSWKIYMFGLLCGICLTSLLLSAVTLLGTFQLGAISASTFSTGIVAQDPRSKDATAADSRSITQENVRSNDLQEDTIPEMNEQMQLLYYDWSNLLNKSINSGEFPGSSILGGSNPLKAPHLENCRLKSYLNRRLDTRVRSERFPVWTIWKGTLNEFPLSAIKGQQETYLRRPSASEGLYPPWITGSDEENYPLTRKAQSDIWLHQHPLNCSHSETKFLLADWERLPRLGIGAQIVAMSSLLSMAISEKRVLVTGYYNRADHDGCKGSLRSSWSCYFFQETSKECRDRAFELMKSKDAWDRGIITGRDNYTSKIWYARAPSVWGKPWNYMQPTTEINGSLIASHRRMDRRWWRAQAVRYLMRFQTEYTCNLLNVARHEAFGWEAAKLVLGNPSANLAENAEKGYDIQKHVWSNHQPWTPRPLLSMHVRMGDKASEMKVAGFEEYMNLAERIRKHFPHLNRIWLSTEMQEVIDGTKLYPHWEFYYTKVPRQVGNTKMAIYEASLGRETSTNTAMVNFLMASKADFFIGALGSTWCFLIDGMRNTGGKVMSGYLSVNKDRFW